MKERADRAMGYFKCGYNCCQSVLMAYADLFDANAHTLMAVSSSFGGGMGRMREVCGTVSAMAFIVGLRYPLHDPADKEMKKKNYETVQLLAKEFARRNGSIICRELLALPEGADSPVPSERTSEYYKRRPCARYAESASEIIGELLFKMENRG